MTVDNTGYVPLPTAKQGKVGDRGLVHRVLTVLQCRIAALWYAVQEVRRSHVYRPAFFQAVRRLRLYSDPHLKDNNVGLTPLCGLSEHLPLTCTAHARELVCIPHGDSFRLVDCSIAGFYHNLRLSGQCGTYTIGGLRCNVPVMDCRSAEILMGIIHRNLPVPDFTGVRVVDIGSAEGYFTFYAAQRGAKVTAIESAAVFRKRFAVLRDYYGLRHCVDLVHGHFPEAGVEAIGDADVIWCLGLLYHLEGNACVRAVDLLTRSGATVVIEGIFYEESRYTPERVNREGHLKHYDPSRQTNNAPICSRWLQDVFAHRGYRVKWLQEWQEYVEQPLFLTHAHTRKVMIATTSR